jgi:hypothetical protein
MPERPHESPLTDLERALLALAPAVAALDRDQLLFEAGRRSARRRGWPFATAALALLAAGLGAALILRPAPPPVERPIVVQVPSPEPSPPDLSELPPDSEPGPPPAGQPGYFQLREQLLARGLDALPLPPPAPAAGPPSTLDDLLCDPELPPSRPRSPGL